MGCHLASDNDPISEVCDPVTSQDDTVEDAEALSLPISTPEFEEPPATVESVTSGQPVQSESWHSCTETVSPRADISLRLTPDCNVDTTETEHVPEGVIPVSDLVGELDLSLGIDLGDEISWPPEPIPQTDTQTETTADNAMKETQIAETEAPEVPTVLPMISGGQEGSREAAACPQGDPGPGVTSPTSPTEGQATDVTSMCLQQFVGQSLCS